jgi:hypothetical protein
MLMTPRHRMILVFLLVFWIANFASAADQKEVVEEKKQPAIAISEEMGDAMAKEAARVKEDIEKQARSLFERKPLGWNWDTINYLYKWALGLPLKIPQIFKHILEQGRVLGFAGSLIILTFIVAVLYSLLGQDRVLARIEAGVQPLRAKMPKASYPYFISALKVVVAALIPLLLLGAFALIACWVCGQLALCSSACCGSRSPAIFFRPPPVTERQCLSWRDSPHCMCCWASQFFGAQKCSRSAKMCWRCSNSPFLSRLSLSYFFCC